MDAAPRSAPKSSGGITVADVTGSVTIDSDGSGDENVRRVGGDFTLHDKGSGDVTWGDIRGRVSVPERFRRD